MLYTSAGRAEPTGDGTAVATFSMDQASTDSTSQVEDKGAGEVSSWDELSGKSVDPVDPSQTPTGIPEVPPYSASCQELMEPQTLVVTDDTSLPLASTPEATLGGEALGGGGFSPLLAGPCDGSRLCRDQRCDPSKVVCSDDTIHHVPLFILQVWSNNPIRVSTSDLRALPGETAGRPDTVVYLMYCDDATCTSGDIVAVDDNGNDETTCASDSKLVASPLEMGIYAVVVASYCSGSGGTADIRIDVNSSSYVWQDRVFGGMTVRGVTSRTNDSVFVGKAPNSSLVGYPSDPEYHDSLLWVFSTSATTCTSRCGSFLFNDDALPSDFAHSRLLLSKVDIPSGFPSSNNAVLVGGIAGRTASDPKTLNGRLMRYRRNTTAGGLWTGTAQRDRDGDGLSQELEALLGSCDDVGDPQTDVGVEGFSCAAFANLVNGYRSAQEARSCTIGNGDPYCWSAQDSDNDGIPDDWEVFGGVVQCDYAPQPPYQNVGACPRLGLHSGWSSCWYYDGCYSLAVSSLSDPDPGAYDVYVSNDTWACSGPWCDGLHSSHVVDETHRLTEDQRDVLTQVWTDEPLTCWDGSDPPCDDPADRPYRARIHVYDGDRHDVPDCNPKAAVPMGAAGTAPYWNYAFDARRRFTGFFRYALAADGGGGQTGGAAPRFIWGNVQNDWAIYNTFTHETGHTLGLDHSFHDAAGSASDCEGGCPGVKDQCGKQPGEGCNGHFNPMLASVMGYLWSGIHAKSPDAPTGTCREACAVSNLRFSKGLRTPLDEAAVQEIYPEGDWRTTKLRQDLHCLPDGNTKSSLDPNVCAEKCDRDVPVTCDGSNCVVDWDRDGPDQNPYPLDISYGRFDGDPNTTCAEDLLVETNEWLSIFAMGKDRLDVVRVPAGNQNWYFTDFTFYGDTFNGNGPANLLAVPVALQHSVTMAEDDYPINVATSGSSCPSGGLSRDICSTFTDCLSGQCTGGRCTCTSKRDCRSLSCGSNWLCSIERGACTCAGAADCPGGGACDAGVCASFRTSDLKVPADDFGPPFFSANFTGPTGGSHIRLVGTGQAGVTDTIAAKGSFGVRLDFRFDGFAPGQTRQALVSSGSFEIAIVADGGNATLEVSSAGKAPLVFPGRDVGRPLVPGLWYRINMGLEDGTVFATVTAWSTVTGWYDSALIGSGCVSKSWAGSLPSTGDVWLGYDGTTGSERFTGAIDNASVANMPVNYSKKTAACEAQ